MLFVNHTFFFLLIKTMDSQLFEGSQPLYDIEPVVNRYIRDHNVISMFNLPIYLAGVDSVTVNVETTSGTTVVSTPVSSLTVATAGQINLASFTTIGCGVLYGPQVSQQYLNKLFSLLPSYTDMSVTTDHSAFNNIMRETVETLSFETFRKAVKHLPEHVNRSCRITDPACPFSALDLAAQELKKLPSSKMTSLMNIVADTGLSVLMTMVSNSNFNVESGDDLTLNAFSPGNVQTSPTYTSLQNANFF